MAQVSKTSHCQVSFAPAVGAPAVMTPIWLLARVASKVAAAVGRVPRMVRGMVMVPVLGWSSVILAAVTGASAGLVVRLAGVVAAFWTSRMMRAGSKSWKVRGGGVM